MRSFLSAIAIAFGLAVSALASAPAAAATTPAVAPLLATDQAVDWWFAYKFDNRPPFRTVRNADSPACRFGGQPGTQETIGQHYILADSTSTALRQPPDNDFIGMRLSDPLGATFDEIERLHLNYVIWNDQFADVSTSLRDCVRITRHACPPVAHAKGVLAWNRRGQGFILQVSTPAWPRAPSAETSPASGNTLGCMTKNNIQYGQHFFAVRLTHSQVVRVVEALRYAAVGTNLNSVLVRNHGPADIVNAVFALASPSPGPDSEPRVIPLSGDVRLVVKPPGLHAPPWQVVSHVLGNEPLLVATWSGPSDILSTPAGFPLGCWPAGWDAPGQVQISQGGVWGDARFRLGDGDSHSKLGVSMAGQHDYVIFGDMNQEGALFATDRSTGCAGAQNGRGGLFFVVHDATLAQNMRAFLGGPTLPDRAAADLGRTSSR